MRDGCGTGIHNNIYFLDNQSNQGVSQVLVLRQGPVTL